MFAGAIYRLADLQINRSSELAAYRERRISNIEQKAPRRGRILDAAGNIIAEDQPTQDLWIIPARRERIDRRFQVVSNLPPLTVDQMFALATSRGSSRDFEANLAATSLVNVNPLVAELAKRLNVKKEHVAKQIVDALLAGRPQSRSDLVYPRLALEDIDFALALEIRSARANPYADPMWNATEIHTGGKRVYPQGKFFGHLTGTIGQLSAEEYVQLRGRWDNNTKIPGSGEISFQGREFFSILSNPENGEPTDEELIIRLSQIKRDGKIENTQGYFLNPLVGRGGLEQYYNQALRGRHVLQRLRLVRDAKSGRRRFEPKGEEKKAVNGLDIRLSVRAEIQRQTHEILEKHITRIARHPRLAKWIPSGVAILMDPNNGRIHSMVSLPTYDPNTFNKDFPKLAGSPAKPLINRAMSGIYPPGSVVKPLVGLAALCEDLISPGEKFFCDRRMMLAGARFTCLGRHGNVDLETAMMHSCNMYFYHTGERLGGRRLSQWYTKLGLGHRTGIDVAGESPGIIPRNAYTGRGWATGNTYHLSIGQGMAVTPLQIAVSYAAIANAVGNVAKVVRPHFLIPDPDSPDTPEGRRLANEAVMMDQPQSEILVDREAVDLIRMSMWETVQGKPGTNILGTGQLARFPAPGGGFFLEVAGKTGTAEWEKNVGGRMIKQISHVWFAGYAPYDRPEVVVVVFLPEAGGGGGSLCAPIAKDLLRMWFSVPDIETDTVQREDALG